MRGRNWRPVFGVLMGIALLLSACAPGPAPLPQTTPTFTPFQPLPPGTHAFTVSVKPPVITPTPLPPQATATQAPIASTPTLAPPTLALTPLQGKPSLWISPDLPVSLREKVNLPPELEASERREGAALRLEAGSERPVSQWVYALAAPFATLTDGVSFEVLSRAWRGEAVGPFAGHALLMDGSTQAMLSALWGAPAPQAVQVVPADKLLAYAWEHQPAWAILPFEALEPRWKVLSVDGISPVRKDFAPAAYALTVPVSLGGEATLAEAVRSVYGNALAPATNRDPGRLTVLAMTGVTALVRATAFAMEQKGVGYPGQDVGPWLREADITHISNEVPFAEGCPYPNPLQVGVRFCSDPRYIGLLEGVGTDVVELTGDHFQDWGAQAMYYTLELYQQRGWPYYGGGANLEEARRAITLEHNGNRLAFIGCNAKGGSFAQAGASQPGAAACGYEWMQNEITRLRAEGYLPIATFQHFEYYTYPAQPDQKRDFRRMAEAGAVVVSGSQAHQPQALELTANALIHYGLGNLFFDQYEVSMATRQGFIDRHVFYDGRYISTELLTILFVDYARPRPMSVDERQELLRAVFAASGW